MPRLPENFISKNGLFIYSFSGGLGIQSNQNHLLAHGSHTWFSCDNRRQLRHLAKLIQHQRAAALRDLLLSWNRIKYKCDWSHWMNKHFNIIFSEFLGFVAPFFRPKKLTFRVTCPDFVRKNSNVQILHFCPTNYLFTNDQSLFVFEELLICECRPFRLLLVFEHL